MPLFNDKNAGAARLAALLTTPQSSDERDLAARYTPIIRFDTNEPFFPQVVGYTIFRNDGPSPSFPRIIELRPTDQPPADFAIEYAIWWDWDIGHLYELEHVWVYMDGRGELVRVEASWHGDFANMAVEGVIAREGTHPVVLSEPGKHAFAPAAAWYDERRQRHQGQESGRLAGFGGVWVTPLFADELTSLRTPEANTLVHTYLQRRRFQPAWDFGHRFIISPELLVPWPALRAWIPGRIAWLIEQLRQSIAPQDRRFWRIGHRGASAHAPDNTAAAIRKAAELGADMVEVDVQMSADGVPVIIHDLEIDRFPGHCGAVKNHTWDELAAIDAGQGERIPTLTETIQLCRELGLGMYIELKAGDAIPVVVQAIQEGNLYPAVIAASFRPDWLAWVKAADPKITTSVLFGAPNVDPVKLAQAVAADYVHPCWENVTTTPHKLLSPEWVQRVHAAGLGIITWHEERPCEIAALSELGVDGICSNTPERLEIGSRKDG